MFMPEFDFYEKRNKRIIFEKENGNTITLLIIVIVKSLQKEQITQITLYDPWFARINLRLTQSDLTPRILTLQQLYNVFIKCFLLTYVLMVFWKEEVCLFLRFLSQKISVIVQHNSILVFAGISWRIRFGSKILPNSSNSRRYFAWKSKRKDSLGSLHITHCYFRIF